MGKEAYGIVEVVGRWRPFILGRKFTLITDQKSVSYLLNTRNKRKIKNKKLPNSKYNY